MPEDAPTVSVVIGAYNAARWIEETLGSVLSQTYRDFEVVVVDDASTDETPDIVKGFEDVCLVRRAENGGSAAARNTGIQAARGRLVAFLDADDLWHPEKLQAQVRLFEKHPELRWAYTDALFFDAETGETIWQASRRYALPEGEVLRPLLVQNFIPFSSVVVRRDVFDAVGTFDTSALHRISEDWDLWLRIAERYPIGVVRRPLTRVRQHAAQKTETTSYEHVLRSRLRIAERAVARNPERLKDLHGKAVANLCLAVGRQLLDREERAAARRVLAHGLRHHPTAPLIWVYWLATFIPRPVLRVLGQVRSSLRKLQASAWTLPL